MCGDSNSSTNSTISRCLVTEFGMSRMTHSASFGRKHAAQGAVCDDGDFKHAPCGEADDDDDDDCSLKPRGRGRAIGSLNGRKHSP
eukprot:131885-Pleurochrysis_carterae.AAC.2